MLFVAASLYLFYNSYVRPNFPVKQQTPKLTGALKYVNAATSIVNDDGTVREGCCQYVKQEHPCCHIRHPKKGETPAKKSLDKYKLFAKLLFTLALSILFASLNAPVRIVSSCVDTGGGASETVSVSPLSAGYDLFFF